MKKLSIAFVTVLMVAGLTASAFADPGWSNGRRYNDHSRNYRMYKPYDQIDFSRHDRRPVDVHRVPVFPPRYGARPHVPPPPPVFSFFLPPFIIPGR